MILNEADIDSAEDEDICDERGDPLCNGDCEDDDEEEINDDEE